MSICAIWIISLDGKEGNKSNIVYSRQYPTVLKRAKRTKPLLCSSLPSDEEIADAILDELQIYRSSDEFIKRFDSCLIQKQAPMYSILDGKVWPIVAISKYNLVFACLPLVETDMIEGQKLNYKEIGPVTIAYSLMQSIVDVIGPRTPGIPVTEDKLKELRDYLFICMPFGTPTEVDPATIRGILSSKESGYFPRQKTPSWRPTMHKSKQFIQLSIQEKVRCVQYDRPEIPDVCEIYGTITCKTELEGAPEVSLDVVTTSDATVLGNMVYHQCVQLSDAVTQPITDDDKNTSSDYGVRSLRFCPPLESFQLCHYKSRSSVEAPPILAYYQMTNEEHCAKIKIQLKLWKKMKNNFENLRVYIPFFNRKPVKRISPMSSNVSHDKGTVCWLIGSKFPSKTLELSLEATVHFSDVSEPVAMTDRFCTGLNSYIEVYFKCADFSYSGLKVDNRSININPSSKVKTSTAAEFVSGVYKVWNSLGDAIG